MQPVVKAPREPVASLENREVTADCFWEATLWIVISCVYVNLQPPQSLRVLDTSSMLCGHA